jgi:hypothetical protein
MRIFVRSRFSSGIRGGGGGEEDIIGAGKEIGFSFVGALGESGKARGADRWGISGEGYG